MDKNKIKKHLSSRFISEETTPGISVTAKVQKDNAKINKDGVKNIEKDLADLDKSLKKSGVDSNKIPANKFTYDDDFEKTYHDEMEILNGQEMLQYDSEPNAEFKKRAKAGIEGSSMMGNQGGIGNAQDVWGASSDDFGKNLVKRVKSSSDKRSKETPTLNLRGRDIQADIKDTGHRPYALDENNTNNTKPQIKEGMKRLKFKKEFNGVGNALKMIPESYRVDNKQFEMTDGNETYKIRWEGNLTEGRAVVLMASDKRMVNEDMAHMKHLMGYKSNETLGLVKGASRISENAAFGDIYNKSKMLLEGTDIESVKAKTGNLEDVKKKSAEATKHVQGSVSKDKGTQAPAAKEGELDDAVSHAPEAKAHVQGSVSTEKGTKAPSPKKGEWEKVKKTSADSSKHVTLKESEEKESEEVEETEEETTTTTTSEVKSKGGNIEDVKASVGYWEDINVPQAKEAKSHVKMGTESKANLETEAKEEPITEGVTLGGIKFEPINEGMYEEGVYEEGTEGYANDNGDEESDIVDAYYNTLVGNNYDNEGQFYAHCTSEKEVVEMILSRLSKVDFNKTAIAATIVYAIKYFNSGDRIHNEEEIENDVF